MIEVPTGTQASAHALMARVQRGGGDLAREYPLVFDEGAPGQVLALADGGTVVAACTTLVRDFVLHDGTTVRGGLIGSVSTDAQFQRHGFGTRLLEQAESRLAQQGAFFSLLWADDPDFYLKRGYGPIGMENDWIIEDHLVPLLPASRDNGPATPADVPDIHALYTRHSARVDRTLEETRSLLECSEMVTLVKRRGDHPVAYAIMGRGIDFQDVIHEWSGDLVDVLSLVRTHHGKRVKERGPGHIFLMAPSTYTGLTETLEALSFSVHAGILGLGKMIDLDAATRWLNERIAPLGQARIKSNPTHIQITVGSEHAELDPGMLLPLCFPAPPVHTSAIGLVTRLGLDPSKLPVSPFAWGLDSI